MAKSETTNENRKPGCELLKIASVTAEHNMTCSNTIQGHQKIIRPMSLQVAPKVFPTFKLDEKNERVNI